MFVSFRFFVTLTSFNINDKHMGKILKCADFGMDCPAEFNAETAQGCLELAKAHGMEVHGQTQEEVDSPEVMRLAAEKTRSEKVDTDS